MSCILVTGGSGFIGGSTVLNLLFRGYTVIILDNLSNSNFHNLKIVTRQISNNIFFYKGNVGDNELLKKIFTNHDIQTVIHMAGLKSVEDSVKNQNLYLNNNYHQSKSLLDFCIASGVKRFIFSSSATVYGNPKYIPIDENHERNHLNPYALSKILFEDYLEEKSKKTPLKIYVLRYFNPVGSVANGLYGEFLNSRSSNLFPSLFKAVRSKKTLQIYGDDYDTADGTAVRDFIHISDLVEAHIYCIRNESNKTYNLFNIGTGVGYSVKNIIDKFNFLFNNLVKYSYTKRRDGDISTSIADPTKANRIIHWKAKKNLDDMVYDAYIFYNKYY
jgi:UDP-glucose 4-epimerase